MLRGVVVRNRWTRGRMGAGDGRGSDRQDGRGVVISRVWGVLTSVRVLGRGGRERGGRGRIDKDVAKQRGVENGVVLKTWKNKGGLKIDRRRRNKLQDICT